MFRWSGWKGLKRLLLAWALHQVEKCLEFSQIFSQWAQKLINCNQVSSKVKATRAVCCFDFPYGRPKNIPSIFMNFMNTNCRWDICNCERITWHHCLLRLNYDEIAHLGLCAKHWHRILLDAKNDNIYLRSNYVRGMLRISGILHARYKDRTNNARIVRACHGDGMPL